jgi:hypothetical protein
MGKDGSTWRHEWIPTNMRAARMKAHGSKSGAAKALRKPLHKMSTRQLEEHYARPDVGNSGSAVTAVVGELERRDRTARKQAAGRQRRASAKSAHRDWLEGQFVHAENTTRGNLVNKRGRAAGIDGRSLFTANANTRSAYASDELKSYWDRNPVVSAAEFQRGRSTSKRKYGVY